MDKEEIKIIDTQYIKEKSLFGSRYIKLLIYLPINKEYLEKIYYPIDEEEYNKFKEISK